MRITRLIFLFSLISLFMPCFTNAQTVRYVAFFPVPYITHMKVNVNTAYFAGRDEGKLEIKGDLSVPTIIASKDLDFSSSTSTATNTVDLSAGSNNSDEDYGDFVVLGANKTITFSSLTSTVAEDLNADDTMNLKSINWGNNIVFKKGTTNPTDDFSKMNALDDNTTGFPSNTTRLCWSPLRIKGTFEYQYYLIAYSGSTCP